MPKLPKEKWWMNVWSRNEKAYFWTTSLVTAALYATIFIMISLKRSSLTFLTALVIIVTDVLFRKWLFSKLSKEEAWEASNDRAKV